MNCNITIIDRHCGLQYYAIVFRADGSIVFQRRGCVSGVSTRKGFKAQSPYKLGRDFSLTSHYA